MLYLNKQIKSTLGKRGAFIDKNLYLLYNFDDKKHVLMVNTTSKLMTKGIECENQYTIQMNGIIEQMQKSGYEILDIKLDASSQIMANMTLIRTLIIYK